MKREIRDAMRRVMMAGRTVDDGDATDGLGLDPYQKSSLKSSSPV